MDNSYDLDKKIEQALERMRESVEKGVRVKRAIVQIRRQMQTPVLLPASTESEDEDEQEE